MSLFKRLSTNKKIHETNNTEESIKNKDKYIDIYLYGPDNSGKTTFLETYKNMKNNTNLINTRIKEFEDIIIVEPTYGYTITTLHNKENKQFNKSVRFFDIGGQLTFKKYLNTLIPTNSNIIYFIDPTSFNFNGKDKVYLDISENIENNKEKNYIDIIRNEINHFLKRNCKLFIYINKIDLVTKLDISIKNNGEKNIMGIIKGSCDTEYNKKIDNYSEHKNVVYILEHIIEKFNEINY